MSGCAYRSTPGLLSRLFRDACLRELDAPKPGNVGMHGSGHDMDVKAFKVSANAAAPAITAARGVGARVWAATLATRRVVDCNTNLGILLLAAPLLEAATTYPNVPLERGLTGVLTTLGHDDARLAFRAVRTANPGGLGKHPDHDVADEPTVTLGEAMAAARDYDRVARQYSDGFADILEGAAFLEAASENQRPELLLVQVYLGYLSRFPDSHVVRRHGEAVALRIQRQAASIAAGLSAGLDADTRPLIAFDTELKAARINPGTSADLTVAALLAALIRSPARRHHLLGTAVGGTGDPLLQKRHPAIHQEKEMHR